MSRRKNTESETKKVDLSKLFAKVNRYAKKAIARQRARQKWNNEHCKDVRLP